MRASNQPNLPMVYTPLTKPVLPRLMTQELQGGTPPWTQLSGDHLVMVTGELRPFLRARQGEDTMTSPIKYFALAVFGMCGVGGGILAGVCAHPIWAAVLIAGTLLTVTGIIIFD